MDSASLLRTAFGVKPKKKDLHKATARLMELLSACGVSEGKVGGVLVRLPMAIFDDCEEQLDHNTATDLMSTFLVAHERAQGLVSDAVKSILARDSIARSPEPARPNVRKRKGVSRS